MMILSFMQTESRDQKLEDVTETVLENTRELCQCGSFLRDRITDEVFQCFPASPQAVTYHAVIHGTASANSSQLIAHIEQWTAEGTNIIIQQVLLRVDGSCAVTVSSLVDEECQLRNSYSQSKNNKLNNVAAALIGGTLAIGIITGVTVTSFIAIMTCCLFKHRSHKKSVQNSHGRRYPLLSHNIYVNGKFYTMAAYISLS